MFWRAERRDLCQPLPLARPSFVVGRPWPVSCAVDRPHPGLLAAAARPAGGRLASQLADLCGAGGGDTVAGSRRGGGGGRQASVTIATLAPSIAATRTLGGGQAFSDLIKYAIMASFWRPCTGAASNMASVAQLVRAAVCGTVGRGFEPHHSPQWNYPLAKPLFTPTDGTLEPQQV